MNMDAVGAVKTGAIIQDAYRTINKTVKPDHFDSQLMLEVMDGDKDGQVGQRDIEKLVERILNA